VILRLLVLPSLLLILWTERAPAQTTHERQGESLKARTRPAAGAGPDLKQVSDLIVEQTNHFRKEQGRGPLKVNDKLTEAAQYFADYLARTNKFSHTADGNHPWDRVKKYGYTYCLVAENIADAYESAGFQTEQLMREFMNGWEHSPGHRKNLLDPDVTEIGVAVAHSAETGYYYAVQDFGRPQSDRLEFSVTNDADATVKYRIESRTFPLPPGYTRTHEMCRPAPVTFRWSNADGPTLRPAGGDHLDVVRSSDGKFAVKKQ
jgi:uncharacterized protein YkwD